MYYKILGRRNAAMAEDLLIESLLRHIGQSVTIFTVSGGLSGSGFTGTLASVRNGTVRLITDIGAAPACPIGSGCLGGFNNYGGCRGFGGWGRGGFGGWGGNWLGSITEIPVNRIAGFTHVAV
jgi:hypothetical protein